MVAGSKLSGKHIRAEELQYRDLRRDLLCQRCFLSAPFFGVEIRRANFRHYDLHEPDDFHLHRLRDQRSFARLVRACHADDLWLRREFCTFHT